MGELYQSSEYHSCFQVDVHITFHVPIKLDNCLQKAACILYRAATLNQLVS